MIQLYLNLVINQVKTQTYLNCTGILTQSSEPSTRRIPFDHQHVVEIFATSIKKGTIFSYLYEFIILFMRNYIRTDILSDLSKLLEKEKIILITGARQIGKTTVMIQLSEVLR